MKKLVDWPLFFYLSIYYVADKVQLCLSSLHFGQEFRPLIEQSHHQKNVLFQLPSCCPCSGLDSIGFMTADQLAQLVEYWTTVREVMGSNPGRTNTQGL